jgi:hypothetical protein
MGLDTYELEADIDAKKFEFVSEGKNGRIQKIVKFMQESDRLYNLAFGDRVGIDDINDISRSDNGDTKKVLATIAAAVEMFSIIFPDTWIHIKGSTDARTRLYQININRFFSEISSMFDVYGLINNEWKKIKPGFLYQAFLVRRRKFILEY